MSDYDVVWSGSSKKPLPGLSGEGFVQRDGSYLTRGADTSGFNRYGDLPAVREMRRTKAQRVQRVKCRTCGRKYRSRISSQIQLCRPCRGPVERKGAA